MQKYQKVKTDLWKVPLALLSISLGVYRWVSCEWEEKQQVTAFPLQYVDTQQVTQLRKHEAAVVLAAACVKEYHLCSVMCVCLDSWHTQHIKLSHMLFRLSYNFFNSGLMVQKHRLSFEPWSIVYKEKYEIGALTSV